MDPRAERAVNQLAWELESRRSIELKVRTTIISRDPEFPTRHFSLVDEHYIESALGQRTCDTTHLQGDEVVRRFTLFSDGSRCAEVQFEARPPYSQESVFIKRTYSQEDRGDWMNRPGPIQLLYVCREPLHKALPTAESLGTGKVLGRDCDIFLFRQLRWQVPQDHVYYLDRATSIPLKVESFKNQAARDAEEPLWAWTAESLDKVQGHFIPVDSQMVNSKPNVTWKYHVESVVFDKEFPTSTFWPVLQPGVFVHDFISLKSYKVPGAERTMLGASERSSNARPTQAVPPQDYLSALSTVSFGVGLAIFFVGIVIWMRCR